MIRTALSQSLNRAGLLAFLAEDAFGGVLAVAGVAVHFDVHRADLKAFVAVDALAAHARANSSSSASGRP